MDAAVDIVVAGDGEEAVPAKAEEVQDRLEPLRDALVLLGFSPVGGVAGEGDEVDRAVLGEMADVLEPGVPEDAFPPPGLVLAAGAFVKVGDVEDAKIVDEESSVVCFRYSYSRRAIEPSRSRCSS